MEKHEESTQFAYTNPKMFGKIFIPSQHVKNKEKEVYIIQYEGVTIEVLGTSDLETPLLLYIDGELKAKINKNGKEELNFIAEGKAHKIHVWNGRAKNFFFTNFIFREGIAITIDEIPVKDTLSDPIRNLKEGKFAIYIFLGLLVLGALLTPLLQSSRGVEDISLALIVYAVLATALLVAIIIYANKPREALWTGLIIGSIETIDFIYSFFAMQGKNFFMFLFWCSVRTGSLYAMHRSLRAIRTILSVPIKKLTSIKRNHAASTEKEMFRTKNVIKQNEIGIGIKKRKDADLELDGMKKNKREIKKRFNKIRLKDYRELISIHVGDIIFCSLWIILSITLLITDRLYKPGSDFILLLLIPILLLTIYKIVKLTYKNYNKKGFSIVGKNAFFYAGNVIIILIMLVGLFTCSYYLYKGLKSKLDYKNVTELIEANKISEAITLLEELTRFNESYEDAHFKLAILYENEFYKNKKIANDLGIGNYGIVDMNIVTWEYRTTLMLNPKNHAARRRLAEFYMHMGDNDSYAFYDGAISEYLELINYNVESLEEYTSLAKAYINSFIFAIKYFGYRYYSLENMIRVLYEGELKYKELQPAAYEYLGVAHYFLNNFSKAILNFEKTINTAGKLKNAKSYYLLGISYYKMDNKVREIENYRIAAKLGDEEAIAWFNKWGLSYKEINDNEKPKYTVPYFPWDEENKKAGFYLDTRMEFWNYLKKIYHPDQLGYNFLDFINRANDDAFIKFWYDVLQNREKIDLSLSEFKRIMRNQ